MAGTTRASDQATLAVFVEPGWAGTLAGVQASREGLADQGGVLRPRDVVEVLHRRLDVRVAHPFLDSADVGDVDDSGAEGMGIFARYAIEDRMRGDAGALARYAAFVASEHAGDRAAAALHYGREGCWARAPFWSRGRGPATVVAPAAP
jgi:hypothetical protein